MSQKMKCHKSWNVPYLYQMHLFCLSVNVFIGQDDSVAALCSLSLAMAMVEAFIFKDERPKRLTGIDGN